MINYSKDKKKGIVVSINALIGIVLVVVVLSVGLVFEREIYNGLLSFINKIGGGSGIR